MKKVLEDAITAHPALMPAYVELMKAAMMLRDWNEVLEVGHSLTVFYHTRALQLGQKSSLVQVIMCD